MLDLRCGVGLLSALTRQSWEEQAPVLWTALVSPLGTPRAPLAPGLEVLFWWLALCRSSCWGEQR